MMKPFGMSKVIITGPKNQQEKVISELHRLEVLHIVEHSKSEIADIGKPLDSASRISEILVRIRSLISTLNVKTAPEIELKKSLEDIGQKVQKLAEEVNASLDELRKVEDVMAKNRSVIDELESLRDINVPLELFSGCKSLANFTGYMKDETAFLSLEKSLSKTTKKYSLLRSYAKKRLFVVLFVDSKNKEKVSELLQKNSFSPVTLIHAPGLKGTALANTRKIENELALLGKKKESLGKKLGLVANEYKGFLLASEQFLEQEIEKAEAPLKFASTQNSFLIRGWIPAQDLAKTIGILNNACSNKIFVHHESAGKHDDVPVKLKNPKYARPFEFFIDLYSYPMYKEIDPTFFVFLTFPIFFGAMLGDIGYGIASFLIFLLLKLRMPKAKNFLNILLLSSFVSILFGFLYGEFFGYEFMHPVISREHEMFKLMYFAIGMGIVHVNIGLVAGFFNEMKSHGLMHAIYAKLSWVVLEIGIAMLALAYYTKVPVSPWVGIAFLAVSILMLLKGEGVKGVIELPGILTNIMSYARIMAIGLSSVILAVIINESSLELFHKGGVYVIIGLFIIVIGHAINIMLGLLGSFLHSLRLHYVEFFSKFFHGGAKKYSPFGLKE